MLDIAAQLRAHAATVRNNPQAREATADAFDLIAAAMDGPPCIDCAAQEHAAADPLPTPEQNEFSAGGTD